MSHPDHCSLFFHSRQVEDEEWHHINYCIKQWPFVACQVEAKFPADMEPAACALLRRMFQVDPSRRATAKEVLLSEYVVGTPAAADPSAQASNVLEMMKAFALADPAAVGSEAEDRQCFDALQPGDLLPTVAPQPDESSAPRRGQGGAATQQTAVLAAAASQVPRHVRQPPQLKRLTPSSTKKKLS